MTFSEVEFVGSFSKWQQTPDDTRPVFAFIGRSNVGKSSFINALLKRKDLARVSSTPGKTQLINYYLIDRSWYLVDLPGYGYAKVSKKDRELWTKMIKDFLRLKPTLVCTFVLLDARIELQENDRRFLNWVGANEIPFAILLTKYDKLNRSQRPKQVTTIKAGLLENWEELPPVFVTSSVTAEGTDEVRSYIVEVVESIENEG